jgi:hypothetical protein
MFLLTRAGPTVQEVNIPEAPAHLRISQWGL